MNSITESITNVKDQVLGNQSSQSGQEPPSGQSGKGTVDSPYDQGNAPEQESMPTAKSGVEPPSGQTENGTLESPYDQGNAPEQAAGPGIEPPSGQQGKGTVDSPYDQGNKPENPAIATESSKSPLTPTQPSPSDPLASPSTVHQGSGIPLSKPTPEQEKVISETRGRDEKAQRTTSTAQPASTKSTGTAAKGGDFDAAKPGAGKEANRLRFERSVSPGQLDDGTHVMCSGDKGQSYDPSASKMNKLKDKFHFGKH